MKSVSVVVLSVVFLLPHMMFSQTERWVYRYSGTSSWANEVCNAICYCPDGNIYAAGTGCHAATEGDIVVTSLTTDGVERWVYTYNGFADFADFVGALVYDADNNLYVGGSSYNSDTIPDFVVISLKSSGTERWIYRHQGPYIGDGCVRAMACGADGNIYAAGYDERFQSGRDFIVVSLDTSGTERWVYRYNGPGNNTDDAYAITYGTDGNLYVAGVSDYNSAVVISLTNSGTERWVYNYHDHYEDRAYSVVYGTDDNVYVIGTCAVYGGYVYPFLTAICLSDSGNENWTYQHSMPSSASSGVLGEDGHLYCAGAYGSDIPVFMVTSISDSGSFEWEYMHGIPTTWATTIVYGPDNHIYAAGCGVDSITGCNLAVVSLYTSGAERWAYSYGGPEFCIANALCYGADSNLYVGGMSDDSVTGLDFTVISLNPIPIAIDNCVIEHFSSALRIYPNPFRQCIEIRCPIADSSEAAELRICDITGRLVSVLFEPISDIGQGLSVKWSGTDSRGNILPPGVYFVDFKSGALHLVQKVVKLQ